MSNTTGKTPRKRQEADDGGAGLVLCPRPPGATLPRSALNMPALRIGITIGLRSPDESLWVNGIKQNALNLACVLLASPLGHRVQLVNTTDVPITDQLPWDLKVFPVVTLEAVKDDLDVLIELGGGISEEQSLQLKSAGTRLVSYCCGSEYVVVLESILFGRPIWPHGVYMNRHYDEIWVIPQVANNSLSFIQTLRRCPAKIVPFVWDPRWLEGSVAKLPHGGRYQPGRPAKRLAVMEPNMDRNGFSRTTAAHRVPERVQRQAPGGAKP
jgi:hypothetical protein